MVFGEGCNISPTPKISPSLKWLSNPKMHRTIILQNANRACCCNPCVTKTFRTAPIGAQLIPRCSPPLLPAVSGGSGPPFAVLGAGKRCSADPRCSPLLPAVSLESQGPPPSASLRAYPRLHQKIKVFAERENRRVTEAPSGAITRHPSQTDPRIPHPLLLRSTGHWGFLTGREEDGERRQQMSSPTRK